MPPAPPDPIGSRTQNPTLPEIIKPSKYALILIAGASPCFTIDDGKVGEPRYYMPMF
tara:strand:- start:337 stop:507 length:171 start_codon:yes stop_codon:yes gene_type:complete